MRHPSRKHCMGIPPHFPQRLRITLESNGHYRERERRKKQRERERGKREREEKKRKPLK